MPKIRVTEVAKLPTGTARFQETVPALKAAYLAKVSEGKVTHVPNWNTAATEDGYTTTTTVSIWNNSTDYETFKNYVSSNYGAARQEYYYSIGKGHEGKNVGAIVTEQQE
jgi:hypothetical protein